MNIEWFNRPIAALGIEGMPRGLTGADWLASWFIAYFVQGKFWTIFSLLFGMGFAVMLVRAERAGREFVGVYDGGRSVNLTDDTSGFAAERLAGHRISATALRALGVTPLIGRFHRDRTTAPSPRWT